jgi:hypothetical protein
MFYLCKQKRQNLIVCSGMPFSGASIPRSPPQCCCCVSTPGVMSVRVPTTLLKGTANIRVAAIKQKSQNSIFVTCASTLLYSLLPVKGRGI